VDEGETAFFVLLCLLHPDGSAYPWKWFSGEMNSFGIAKLCHGITLTPVIPKCGAAPSRREALE
jgi:hypothetical protein